MDYKLVSRVETILVKGNLLRVSLYSSVLDDIDWNWDSLLFPGNETIIAAINSLCGNGNNALILTTSGETKIKDLQEDRYLEFNEIVNLASNGDLYNELIDGGGIDIYRYEIEANNWFCMEFHEGDCIVDDYTFDVTPQNPEELEDILIQAYLDYFNKEV